MCVCTCETSSDRCPSPPPPAWGRHGQVWSHANLQLGGSPERPAASDTLHIRLRRVFQKALHSLGQELTFFFPLKKHVYFSRNLIPGVPTLSHLHQLKWHFWRDMWSCRSLRRLSSAWYPFSFLDLKQKKRKSRFIFKMILTKSFLQIGWDWIFFSHGVSCHIVLLLCMMEAAVRPQAVVWGPVPGFTLPKYSTEHQTRFCSGGTPELVF